MLVGNPISKFEEAGARWDDLCQAFFCKWGSFCARHPIIVLIGSTVLVVVCCLGWTFFSVTTDPVQLWSAPNSRVRLEKDYFDDHFGKFYRTEQIIIRPKNMSPVFNYLQFVTDPEVHGPYGPVYDIDFLREVCVLSMVISLRLVNT